MNQNIIFAGLIPIKELAEFVNNIKSSLIEKDWYVISIALYNDEYFQVSIKVAEKYAGNMESLLENLLVMTKKSLNWQRIGNCEGLR